MVARLALLAACVWLVYAPTIKAGLAGFDDNPLIEGALSPGPRAEGSFYRLVLGRELRNVSHRVDAALFGSDLRGHHAMNVLHHTLASAAAFGAAWSVLGAPGPALVAALAFALHPVQTESVAYLAGRRDLLYGGLCLLAFWLWRRRSPWAAAAVWLLAVAAKPSAIVLPALVLIAESAPRRRAWLFVGAAAAVGLWAVARESAQPIPATAAHHLNPLWYGDSPWANWAVVPRVLWHALTLLVWPAKLSADYTFRVFEPGQGWLYLLPLAGVAAAAWRWQQARFALLWLAIAYVPHLPLIPSVHNIEVFAEHWLYLAAFGPAVAFGAACRDKRLAALVLVLLAARTWHRARDWRDDLTLWSSTAAAAPQSARARNNLGYSLHERGRFDEAAEQFKAALAIAPQWPLPRHNLGMALLELGRFDEAAAEFRRAGGEAWGALVAVELRRGRAEPARLLCRDLMRRKDFKVPSLVLHNCGVLAHLRGNYAMAEDMLSRAVSARLGSYPMAEAALASLYLDMDRVPEAEAKLRSALRRAPDYAPLRSALAVALARNGRRDEALAELRRAREAGLDEARAALLEAVVLRETGGANEALGILEDELKRRASVDALSQAGQTLAALKRWKDADAAFELALRAGDQPRDYYLWAKALLAQGRRAEARALAERGAARYPTYAPLKSLVGKDAPAAGEVRR